MMHARRIDRPRDMEDRPLHAAPATKEDAAGIKEAISRIAAQQALDEMALKRQTAMIEGMAENLIRIAALLAAGRGPVVQYGAWEDDGIGPE